MKKKKKKYKIAKPIITMDTFCRSVKHANQKERALGLDEDHKLYVRIKRYIGLPNTWDTQWINRSSLKSWKFRCKKKRQWMYHVKCFAEKILLSKTEPIWRCPKCNTIYDSIDNVCHECGYRVEL